MHQPCLAARGHRAWGSPGTPKHPVGCPGPMVMMEWDGGVIPLLAARKELCPCPSSPASVLCPDPTSLIPHHGPCTLLPTSQSWILHPTSCIPQKYSSSRTQILNPAFCNPHPVSHIADLHPSASVLHLEPFILHSTPAFQCSIPAQNRSPAFRCCTPVLHSSSHIPILHSRAASHSYIPSLCPASQS